MRLSEQVAGPAALAARRDRVVADIARLGCDALLVTAASNVRYLTGFTGTNGWLLLGAGGVVLLTDPRYTDQAAAEVRGVEVEVSTVGLYRRGGEVSRKMGWRRLAFESTDVTLDTKSKLDAAFDAQWVSTAGLVEQQRLRKDDAEVAAMRAALATAERALVAVAAQITPGQTESEVAARLEYECRRRGATAMSFETIVAAGERSALPHGVATQRPIGCEEPVMIDMGCVVDGYCSDITRMVWVGNEPSPAWLRLCELVDSAREAGLGAVRPGVDGRDVDAAARAVIERAGHAEAFSHGTGHGVGLDIHEPPTLSVRGKTALEVGMVATIEPAVYLRGRFGVRIEDMVVVAKDGCERLTTLGTEPILRKI